MRFMMLMIPKGYEKAAPGTMPDAKAVAAMMKYNESLQKAGVLLALDGLHPPSMGARVSFSGGKPKVTDGPFTETKEVLGGYWMIQVKSKEEAVEWASRCPGFGQRSDRSSPGAGVLGLSCRCAEGGGQVSRDAGAVEVAQEVVTSYRCPGTGRWSVRRRDPFRVISHVALEEPMLKIIALIVVVLIVAVLVYAATKPDTFRVQRSASIKAPADTIFPLINDFQKWGGLVTL